MLRCQGNTNRANTVIREDRRITVSEVADMLDGSSGSACVTLVSISLCLWLVKEKCFYFLNYLHRISENNRVPFVGLNTVQFY
jgi:hypothetical protein